jgi:hypothetical protein
LIRARSPTCPTLDLQAKRFNQVHLYDSAVANLHRYGLAIQAGTMFGLDGDDSGIFERNLRVLGPPSSRSCPERTATS